MLQQQVFLSDLFAPRLLFDPNHYINVQCEPVKIHHTIFSTNNILLYAEELIRKEANYESK